MHTPQPSLIAKALVFAIVLYRNTLRAFMLPSCRFMPTCSEYALQAVEKLGARRGAWRALWRLLRCQPFARGNWDPVD